MTRRSFGGTTVLVTGAGGGLGRALALRFAAAGASRVVFMLPPDPADKLLPQLDRLAELARRLG